MNVLYPMIGGKLRKTTSGADRSQAGLIWWGVDPVKEKTMPQTARNIADNANETDDGQPANKKPVANFRLASVASLRRLIGLPPEW
jgi:hypothetical protein